MLQVGVIQFATDASVDLELTSDIGLALETVQSMNTDSDGWTALHLGMEQYREMIAEDGSQNPNATKLLVAISDGNMMVGHYVTGSVADDDGACPETCYGYTCDYWVLNSLDCSTMENTYDCDCNGCACGEVKLYSNFQEVVEESRLIKAMNHTIVGIYVNNYAGSDSTFRGEQEMYWFSSCTTNDCMQGTSVECWELSTNDNTISTYGSGGCTDYETGGSKCLENEGYCCTETCEGISVDCDQEFKGGCQFYNSSQDCSVDCLYYFDGTFEELDALAGPLASDITKSLAGTSVTSAVTSAVSSSVSSSVASAVSSSVSSKTSSSVAAAVSSKTSSSVAAAVSSSVASSVSSAVGSTVGAKAQEIDESARCIFDPAWFSCLILILPLIMYSRTQQHRTYETAA